jgi:hypothetical protein
MAHFSRDVNPVYLCNMRHIKDASVVKLLREEMVDELREI